MMSQNRISILGKVNPDDVYLLKRFCPRSEFGLFETITLKLLVERILNKRNKIPDQMFLSKFSVNLPWNKEILRLADIQIEKTRNAKKLRQSMYRDYFCKTCITGRIF